MRIVPQLNSKSRRYHCTICHYLSFLYTVEVDEQLDFICLSCMDWATQLLEGIKI
jgi:hypothetical protein